MFLLQIKIKRRKAEQRGAVPEGSVALALCRSPPGSPQELWGLRQPPRCWPCSRAVSAVLGTGLGWKWAPRAVSSPAGPSCPRMARAELAPRPSGLGHLAWPGLGLCVCQRFCLSQGPGQGCAGNSLCSLQPEFSLQDLQGSTEGS